MTVRRLGKTMFPGQDHRVQIRLKSNNIWDIDSRLNEVNQIRYWLDELTEWQPEYYSIRIHSSGGIMDVWFKKEEHAIMCSLRWL